MLRNILLGLFLIVMSACHTTKVTGEKKPASNFCLCTLEYRNSHSSITLVTTRKFINDSVFVDNCKATNGYLIPDTFLVTKTGDWYYRFNGVFYTYFSKKDFEEKKALPQFYSMTASGHMDTSSDFFVFIPKKKIVAKGRNIYLFGCYWQNDNASREWLYDFWFDPEMGSLIETDFLETDERLHVYSFGQNCRKTTRLYSKDSLVDLSW